MITEKAFYISGYGHQITHIIRFSTNIPSSERLKRKDSRNSLQERIDLEDKQPDFRK